MDKLKFENFLHDINVWAVTNRWYLPTDTNLYDTILKKDIYAVLKQWEKVFVKMQWQFMFFIVYDSLNRLWNPKTMFLYGEAMKKNILAYLWHEQYILVPNTSVSIPGTVNQIYSINRSPCMILSFGLGNDFDIKSSEISEENKIRRVHITLSNLMGDSLINLKIADSLDACVDFSKNNDRENIIEINKYKGRKETGLLAFKIENEFLYSIVAKINPQASINSDEKLLKELSWTLENIAFLLRQAKNCDESITIEKLRLVYYISSPQTNISDVNISNNGGCIVIQDATGNLPELDEQIFITTSLLIEKISGIQKTYFQNKQLKQEREFSHLLYEFPHIIGNYVSRDIKVALDLDDKETPKKWALFMGNIGTYMSSVLNTKDPSRKKYRLKEFVEMFRDMPLRLTADTTINDITSYNNELKKWKDMFADNISIGESLEIYLPHGVLEIIFSNLLSNTKKCNKDRTPKVYISAEQIDDGCITIIYKEDQGKGFDLETIKNIKRWATEGPSEEEQKKIPPPGFGYRSIYKAVVEVSEGRMEIIIEDNGKKIDILGTNDITKISGKFYPIHRFTFLEIKSIFSIEDINNGASAFD